MGRLRTSGRTLSAIAAASAMSWGDLELGEGRGEILHDRVEMRFGELHLRMGRPHILAAVVHRAAEGEGQEGLLLGTLSIHVDGVEEVRNALVNEHFAVKNIDRGVDRRFAAKPSYIEVVMSSLSLRGRCGPKHRTRRGVFAPRFRSNLNW